MSAPARGLRVLLVCQPVDAGVPQHVLDLVRELPGSYEFDVMCPPGHLLWRELAGAPRVRLHPLGAGRLPGPRDALSFLHLLRLVRAADVVHAHSSKAGVLVRLAAALTLTRGRTIFTPHCWSFWAAEGGRRRLYLLVERVCARWCRRIVAVSAYERDSGLAEGVGRAVQYVIVRNGVDLSRFSAEPRPVAGRVLMVGRLAPQKRPDLALRALAQLESVAQGLAELQLVGHGPLEEDLPRLAAELGLDGVVEFLGPRSDVPELLSAAHCFLLTSDYEGCPISVLEAMAAGVPVVAVRSGGLDEVVQDGETGLLAGDAPEDVAAALRTLLEDPAAARSLGTAARRVAEARFGRRLPAEQIDALYREVADLGRRDDSTASAH